MQQVTLSQITFRFLFQALAILIQCCLLAPKLVFHSVNLNFCQMVNSQAIIIKLEATMHRFTQHYKCFHVNMVNI